jgi:hypothetical protein
VAQVAPARRALHVLRWTVLRMQKWWRNRQAFLSAWLQVSVRQWSQFEEAERLERVPDRVKASILLEDFHERRRAFIAQQVEWRRASVLRHHAIGSARFLHARRQQLAEEASEGWCARLARFYDAHAAELDKAGAISLAPGAQPGVLDTPSQSRRQSKSAQQQPSGRARKPSLAPARTEPLRRLASAASVGTGASQSRRGSLQPTQSTLRRGSRARAATLASEAAAAAAEAATDPQPLGALPPPQEMDARLAASEFGAPRVPFRLSLQRRNCVADEASEETKITVRVFGKEMIERYVVAVQRQIRGHLLRKLIRLEPFAIPDATEAPRWQNLTRISRLPRLIGRARAKLRNPEKASAGGGKAQVRASALLQVETVRHAQSAKLIEEAEQAARIAAAEARERRKSFRMIIHG